MPAPASSAPSTSSRAPRRGRRRPAASRRPATSANSAERQVDQRRSCASRCRTVRVDEQRRPRPGRGSWTGRSPGRRRRTPCRCPAGRNRSRIRPKHCGIMTAREQSLHHTGADQRRRATRPARRRARRRRSRRRRSISIRLRPNMSPSRPPVSRPDRQRQGVAGGDPLQVGVACRRGRPWIDGAATLTTVESSRFMMVAARTRRGRATRAARVRYVVHGRCHASEAIRNGLVPNGWQTSEDMLETSARLLRLLSLLQTPREWTGTELADRLEVSTRTVRNDVDRLRNLGYPVHATRGAVGGYRLGAGRRPAAAAARRRGGGGGRGRPAHGRPAARSPGSRRPRCGRWPSWSRCCPSRLRRRVNALQTYTVSVPARRRGPTVDAERADRRSPRRAATTSGCASTTATTTAPLSRRDVEPYRLVNWGRRWYLVAWDIERHDWRTFRVDRIDRRSPDRPRFAPRELPDEDLAALRRPPGLDRALALPRAGHGARPGRGDRRAGARRSVGPSRRSTRRPAC